MTLTLAERLDPTSTALLVIDVQNDYANPAGFLGQRGGNLDSAVEMLPRLRSVIEAAHAAGVFVVFTRNWHRPETDSPAWRDRLERTGLSADNRPGRAGTWGAELYGVQPGEGDQIVDKFRYDAFLGTNLDFLLRARGIRTVVCTGTATNVCVESTARAAHMRDYHLVLIGDCCASTNQDLHDATLRNVERSFGVVTPAETVIALWQSALAPEPPDQGFNSGGKLGLSSRGCPPRGKNDRPYPRGR